MCQIIYAPAKVEPTDKLVQRSMEQNPDGWGIMYPAGSSGVVTVHKGLNEVDFYRALDQRPINRPAVIHFRWGTHGSAKPANCHPFEVHKGLWMVHNGVLPFNPPGDWSDTRWFARILKEFPAGFHRDPNWIGKIKLTIRRDRMVFMGRYGRVTIINEKVGAWTDGVWISSIR